MQNKKLKALVVNDDGIDSSGLKVLVDVVCELGYEVLVVAPYEEQSAKSHALNFRGPFKLREDNRFSNNVKAYSLTGTPADCVKFAYYQLKYPFDIVFSGVNNGLNLGFDILYSGTVGAASEGALLGAKAIAVSTKRGGEEAVKEQFVSFFHEFQQTSVYKTGNIFNINVPLNAKGYMLTHQGYNNYLPEYVQNTDGTYMSVLSSEKKKVVNDTKTDIVVYFSGYISVTPLTIDRTDYRLFKY